MFNLHTPKQQQHGQCKERDIAGLAYLAASSHATCLIVFLRCSFGREAFRLNAVLALLLMIVFGSLAEAPELYVMAALWVAFLMVHRFKTMWRLRRGSFEHSRYGGYPWLALKMPLMRSEDKAKGVAEPALCLVIGGLLMTVSPALGGFVMFGFLSLAIKAGLESTLDRLRGQAMRDAYIENTVIAERFRGERGDF